MSLTAALLEFLCHHRAHEREPVLFEWSPPQWIPQLDGLGPRDPEWWRALQRLTAALSAATLEAATLPAGATLPGGVTIQLRDDDGALEIKLACPYVDDGEQMTLEFERYLVTDLIRRVFGDVARLEVREMLRRFGLAISALPGTRD